MLHNVTRRSYSLHHVLYVDVSLSSSPRSKETQAATSEMYIVGRQQSAGCRCRELRVQGAGAVHGGGTLDRPRFSADKIISHSHHIYSPGKVDDHYLFTAGQGCHSYVKQVMKHSHVKQGNQTIIRSSLSRCYHTPPPRQTTGMSGTSRSSSFSSA